MRNLFNKFKKEKKNQYGWFGRYSSWAEACAVTEGYDKQNILMKTKESLLKIKEGKAVYERDSVLFDKKEYPFPLITFIQHSALLLERPLNVLDFGGSLGSSYFQIREFLTEQVCETWNVVEQAHYVSCGKQFFEDGKLRFVESIDKCVSEMNIDLILLSGVIQYLENPHLFLDSLTSFGFRYIIFDRTAFIHEDSDRLTVQKVWPSVYEASYPSWFFNEESFLSHFEGKYDVKAEFATYVKGEETIEVDHQPIGYDKGFYMVLK